MNNYSLENAPRDIFLADDQEARLSYFPKVGVMPHAHCHDEVEMNLVTRGRAVYLLSGRRYELRANTIVWLFPGQNHILLEMSPDFDYWLGLYRPRLLARVCAEPETQPLLGSDPPGDFCRTLKHNDAERLVTLFQQVESAPGAAARDAGIIFSLLTAWAAFLNAPEPGEDALSAIHPSIESVARRIRDESGAPGIDVLAADVGLSPAYLSALFKQQMGMGIAEFRNRQRLRRFTRLRSSRRGETLLETALEAGFGSYAQFYRVFREHMGRPPAEGMPDEE